MKRYRILFQQFFTGIISVFILLLFNQFPEILKVIHTSFIGSAVLKAMSDFETCYYSMKRMIETGDFDGFEREFARGKLLRDSWIEYKQTGLKDVGRIGD